MKRIKELFGKIVSVKGLFAGVCTAFFFLNPGQEWAFWSFMVSWLVFIGERLVLKVLSVLKK